MKRKAVIYIHGKGGQTIESKHYEALFNEYDVFGFDYKSQTPWEAKEEFDKYFELLFKKYEKVILIANSIGAYFSLHSLTKFTFEKVFLISPIVDMDFLIKQMMKYSNVTEEELYKKGEISTNFGEVLSWNYYSYVKSNPIVWNTSTFILYGENDTMMPYSIIDKFAKQTNSYLTVMKNGEHWFHTKDQMIFLDSWIMKVLTIS